MSDDRATLPDGTLVRVRNDNVLVLLEPDGVRELASGILAPGGTRKANAACPATVIAVGPGVHADVRLKPSRSDEPVEQSPTVGAAFIPTTVKPGDRVLLDTSLAGDFLRTIDDQRYRLCREAEVLAVLDDGTEVQ